MYYVSLTFHLPSFRFFDQLSVIKRKHLVNQRFTRCSKYPEPGSNRHGLPHWCLRPARLPIPPSGLFDVWLPSFLRIAAAKLHIILEMTNFLCRKVHVSFLKVLFVWFLLLFPGCCMGFIGFICRYYVSYCLYSLIFLKKAILILPYRYLYVT